MNVFRSSLVMALVSAFLLAGYAHAVLEPCCAAQEQVQSASQDASQPGHDCHCLCHQAQGAATALAFCAFLSHDSSLPISPDEFPPEAPPAGIEHPPQLA